MEQNITMRCMKTTDLENAIRLWNETPGVVVREEDDSKEGIARFLARNPNTTLVLEKDGEIIGTLLCGNDGRRGFLYHFVVHPDYRRRGLGKMMLQKVYTELEKEGLAKGGLVALKTNTSGLAFWQHSGWVLRDDLYYLDFPLTGSGTTDGTQ